MKNSKKYECQYVVKRTIKAKNGLRFITLSLRGGRTLREYNSYIKDLSESGMAWNTTEAYAQDLARFYDFFICAQECIVSQEYKETDVEDDDESSYYGFGELILQTPLSRIFKAFPSFLVEGQHAHNNLARLCAIKLNHDPLANSSASRMITSVRQYISASASLQYSLIAYKNMDIIDVDVDDEIVGKELLSRTEMSSYEQKTLLANSYLAGCIRSGVRYTTPKLFKIRSRTETTLERSEKAFPVQFAVMFVESFVSYRDKAIYALIFGGGLRPHEAYQLKLSDIDFVNESVILSSPDAAEFAKNFQSLSQKGVSHPEVYLIEPFKSFLFDALEAYIEYERPESDSEYVFLMSERFGAEPYYKASRESKIEVFKQNLERCGLADLVRSPHSGRHFYGFFLRNFIPNSQGGYGLSKYKVQEYMRHKRLSSTEIYAVKDREELKEVIAAANTILNSGEVMIADLPGLAKNLLMENLLGVQNDI